MLIANVPHAPVQEAPVVAVRDADMRRNALRLLRPTRASSTWEHAEYVILETPGSNALDFHIAYYIGALSCQEPSACFHILSKDSGFDPLLKYLKGEALHVQRSVRLADIPCFKPALPATEEARIQAVIADLTRRQASKPRTEKTLRSTLNALFKKELS